MVGNVRKFGFLRNPLSELGWLMLQKCKFFEWILFWKTLKKFLRVVWPYSIYWEGRLIPYLYSRKRIRVIEHIDQKIFTKSQFFLKKTWFEPSSLDTTVGTLPSKFGKFLRKWTQNFRFEKLWGHIKKLTALLDLRKSHLKRFVNRTRIGCCGDEKLPDPPP